MKQPVFSTKQYCQGECS